MTKSVAEASQPMRLGDVLINPKEVSDSYWIAPEDLEAWQFLKGAKSVRRVSRSSGYEYQYKEGKMAFPDSLDAPSRTIVTGEGGKSPSRFKHVVQQDGRYRRLMPIELESLNGFPDDWTSKMASGSPVSDTKRAFLMGNALVIGAVERIIRQIGCLGTKSN